MKKLIFILVFALAYITGFSQWQHSGGPEGKRVDNLEYAQGRLFADMSYYSDDNGDSWNAYSTLPFTDKPVNSFIEAGNRILVAGNDKVYASENKGDSWTEKTSGLPGDMVAPHIFTDGNTVYLVTHSPDLYSSANYGDSWSSVTTNLGDFKIKDMVFLNDTIVAYTKNPFTADDAIHWSVDAETWTSSNFPDKAVESLEAAHGKVYAIAQNDGLYISSDDGNTFTNENANITTGTLVENDNNLFYFSKDDGVNLLSEDGSTLTPKQDGIVTNLLSNLVSGNNILFLGTYSGVYRSADDAENWTLANAGLGYQPVNEIVSMGDTLFAGTNDGVWRSYSYGLRWVPVGLNGKEIYSMVYANNAIYVVARVNNTVENVYMSDDLGATWEVVGSNIPSTQYAPIEAFGSNLILSTSDGIYKLANFTGDWQKVKTISNQVPVAIWSDGDYLYVGGEVLQRTQNLSNWVNLAGLNDGISMFTKDSEYHYAGGMHRGGSVQQMYRSSDGIDFTVFKTGLPNCDGRDLITRNDTTYFAFEKLKTVSPVEGDEEMTVSWTVPGATEWTQFQEILSDVYFGNLHNTDESLLLATETSAKGIYRYDFQSVPEVSDTVDQIEYPPVSIIEENKNEYGVVTIYPNPVSNLLTIQSPKAIQSASIYDLGGKMVKQTATDGNTAMMDMSGLDAGMYLLRVQGQDGKVSMHKIIKQ